MCNNFILNILNNLIILSYVLTTVNLATDVFSTSKYLAGNSSYKGVSLWLSSKDSVRSAGDRAGFDPWTGKMLWRRKWQPTPVFWRIPRQRSLMGHSPWGHKSVGHNLVTKQQQAAISFCACHFAICLCLSLSYTRRYFSKLFHILLEN